jgi:hypothetical protein
MFALFGRLKSVQAADLFALFEPEIAAFHGEQVRRLNAVLHGVFCSSLSLAGFHALVA